MSNYALDIELAKISQFLAADDSRQQSLFLNSSIVKRTCRLIYLTRYQIEKAYLRNNTDSTLTSTTNYLISLCGKYLAEARTIYGNATGTVVTPGGSPVPITFTYPLDVTITAGLSGVKTYQNDNFKGSFGWTNLVINSDSYQYYSGGAVIPNNPFTVDTTLGIITFLNYTLQTNDVISGLYL